MAKVKKLEYVDFGEILAAITPNISNMGAYIEGEDGDEFCLSQLQTLNTPLTLKKRSSRSPIFNLAHWVLAWNAFYEATLHHHPAMHFQLYTYFKHVIEYSTNHKFAYLMAYDQTHRIQIAAQRHLPPNSQTASWTIHSSALFNTYLRDNKKSQCAKCHAYGHFEKQCPKNATPTAVNTVIQQQSPKYQQATYSQQHGYTTANTPQLSSNASSNNTIPRRSSDPQTPQFRNVQQQQNSPALLQIEQPYQCAQRLQRLLSVQFRKDLSTTMQLSPCLQTL